MDENLFRKHLTNINKRKNNKEEIILHIKENTGVELDESTITLSKKIITLHISSATRQRLFQKNITEILKQKGYILKI